MKTRKSKRKYQARGNCFKIQFQFRILDEAEINPLDHGNVISSLTQRGQDTSQINRMSKDINDKKPSLKELSSKWMMRILINYNLIWKQTLSRDEIRKKNFKIFILYPNVSLIWIHLIIAPLISL